MYYKIPIMVITITGNIVETTCAAVTKQDNHENIYDAICDMDSTVLSAERLLDRIKGEVSPTDTPDVPTSPSLVEVLQRSPQMIYDRNKRLHEILDEITEYLF